MSKSAEAFRTISEVAEVLDTPAHVLRFWESRFSQIKPVKRAGGRRYYRPADVALLGGIRRLLHDDGLTIRGVQKILREQGVRHVAAFAGLDVDDGLPDDAHPAPVAPAAAAQAAAPWPAAPAPDPAPADTHLVRDPDDVLPAAEPQVPAPAKNPFAPPLPDTTPGYEARADLQRERDTANRLQTPIKRGGHQDFAPAEGDFMPAAALLRAMTTFHATERRGELRAIYQRLSALHARRRALGHRDAD